MAEEANGGTFALATTASDNVLPSASPSGTSSEERVVAWSRTQAKASSKEINVRIAPYDLRTFSRSR
jgi:hypothetical protein